MKASLTGKVSKIERVGGGFAIISLQADGDVIDAPNINARECQSELTFKMKQLVADKLSFGSIIKISIETD